MKHPVTAKKSFGQHFLNDDNISAKIVAGLRLLEENTCIVEVGPGTGALTQFLAKMPNRLVLVELDKESAEYLGSRAEYSHAEILQRDFLALPLSEISTKPLAVIGNFPYNISGPLFFKALEEREFICEWVGMFQLEVIQRIVASPGSKIYGKLSVLLQAYFQTELMFKVSPGVFIPPPKVMSAVIRMVPKTGNLPQSDYKDLKALVKAAFSQRRKTLRNSLKPFMDVLDMNDPVMNRRPETLSWEEFDELWQRRRIK